MFFPDPEYPWKWYSRLEGHPSEYLELSTVGNGTILHKEQRKHFCISASSSFNRDKAMTLIYAVQVQGIGWGLVFNAERALYYRLHIDLVFRPAQLQVYHLINAVAKKISISPDNRVHGTVV